MQSTIHQLNKYGIDLGWGILCNGVHMYMYDPNKLHAVCTCRMHRSCTRVCVVHVVHVLHVYTSCR